MTRRRRSRRSRAHGAVPPPGRAREAVSDEKKSDEKKEGEMGEAARKQKKEPHSSRRAFAQGGVPAAAVQLPDGWYLVREVGGGKPPSKTGPFDTWEEAIIGTGARGAAIVGRNAARLIIEAQLGGVLGFADVVPPSVEKKA